MHMLLMFLINVSSTLFQFTVCNLNTIENTYPIGIGFVYRGVLDDRFATEYAFPCPNRSLNTFCLLHCCFTALCFDFGLPGITWDQIAPDPDILPANFPHPHGPLGPVL